MNAFDRVKARLPTAGDGLIYSLMEDAQDAILAYTGLKTLPAGLAGAHAQLAVVYYNRLGIEGETGHSEGSVNRTLELMPGDIKAQLTPYRVAKVVDMCRETSGSGQAAGNG